MAVGDVLTLGATTQYVAALAMLALAATLLVLDPRGRINRAFALFLLFRALGLGVGGADAVLGGTRLLDIGAAIAVVGTLASLVYFAALWPRARGFVGTHRAGVWVLAGFSIAITAYTILDPCYLYCKPSPTGPTQWGPLAAVHLSAATGFAGLAFLLEHAKLEPGPRREGMRLTGLAFSLNAVFDGLRSMGALVAAARAPQGLAAAMGSVGDVWFYLFVAGPLVGLALGAAAVVVAARADGRISMRLLSAAGVAILSGAIVGYSTIGELTGGLPLLIVGAWRLAIPAAVGYVLLRHQLFDLDVKLKLTIQRSTLTGIFIGAFFAVEQLIQAYTNQVFGILGGALAAGVLIFALGPLQRMAERLAHTAVKPKTQAAPEEAYQAAVEMAVADGPLTRVEERYLASIATRLGLDAERAFTLRDDVERRQGGTA